MWMPAQLVYSISFNWRNSYSDGANWSPEYVGLKLRNALTGATQRWSAGVYFSPVYENISKIYRIYNTNEFYALRALDPEWFVYGLLFHFGSKSTSYLSVATGYLTDCRIGWDLRTSTGYRMICPREMNWNDFFALYKEGLRYYQ